MIMMIIIIMIIIIIIIIIITRIELNFVKHLRIKISIKNLTHRFDVAMASSSEKDKTKS